MCSSDLGDIVKISPSAKPEVFDKAPSGRLYVDGSVAVEEDSRSIKERRNISANGVLDVTILITPKGNIHNKPILNYSGLPINNDEDYQYELENVIEKTARAFSLNNHNQKDIIILEILNRTNKWVNLLMGNGLKDQFLIILKMVVLRG